MTELSFAVSFLNSVGSRPTRLSLEHVEDPHSFPAKGAYILPKMPRPISKRQKLAPGAERLLTIHLKSPRNPPLDIKLPSKSPLTSILELKTEVSNQASIPVDKIRILHQKKPVGDSKVVKDLITDHTSALELSIMVMGGAGSVRKDDATAAASVQGDIGTQVLATQEFWDDLDVFLAQRLKDQAEGEKVCGIFRKAWDEQSSASSRRLP